MNDPGRSTGSWLYTSERYHNTKERKRGRGQEMANNQMHPVNCRSPCGPNGAGTLKQDDFGLGRAEQSLAITLYRFGGPARSLQSGEREACV